MTEIYIEKKRQRETKVYRGKETERHREGDIDRETKRCMSRDKERERVEREIERVRKGERVWDGGMEGERDRGGGR